VGDNPPGEGGTELLVDGGFVLPLSEGSVTSDGRAGVGMEDKGISALSISSIIIDS
jgi:hypothetical protein